MRVRRFGTTELPSATLGSGGRILRDVPQQHEIHKLLGQVWFDSVARDEDAVVERADEQIDEQVFINVDGEVSALDGALDGSHHRLPTGSHKAVAKNLRQGRIARQVRRQPREDRGGRGVGETAMQASGDGDEVTACRPGVGTRAEVLEFQ
jgi:hypothetical protein